MSIDRVGEDYGYRQDEGNNWYMTGRVPANTMYVPINFDLNKRLDYDPISRREPMAMANDTLYIATEEEKLSALDLKNFKIKWQYTYIGTYGHIMSVTVKDNMVFVLRPASISALEDMGSSYRLLWEERTEGAFNDVTYDDRNLYHTMFIAETPATSESYKVIARNPLTGRILWEHALGISPTKLVTGENKVYIGGYRRGSVEPKAAALDSRTGEMLWEKVVTPTGSPYKLVYSDGALYMPLRKSEGVEIYAFDTRTGNNLWSYTYAYDFKETNSDAISVNKDIVLFLDRIDNMIALDKKTGAVKWKTTYGDGNNYYPKYETRQRPILTDSQIFVDKNKKIKVFNAGTGALIKEYSLSANGKYGFAIMMLNADRMILQSQDGFYFSFSDKALLKIKYIIQPGDTLYKIAVRFNTSVQYLALLNNLDVNSVIYIGQSILVPREIAVNYVQYTVKQGDTLYKIAAAHNTTINDIIAINNIANVNSIYPGQILRIPVPVIHTVIPGDSLWAIANKYNVTIQEIMHKNGLTNPNLIYVGQKLIIK